MVVVEVVVLVASIDEHLQHAHVGLTRSSGSSYRLCKSCVTEAGKESTGERKSERCKHAAPNKESGTCHHQLWKWYCKK